MRSGVTPETRYTGAPRARSARCAGTAALLLLSLLFLPLRALSAAGPEHGRHLRVVAAPYEPFAFERDGVPSGLDIDLLNVVCRANRWTYELEWVPFGEVWQRLSDGRADLAVGALYATPERRASFPMTRTYLRTGLGIVSRPDRPVNGPADLRGLRIGVKAKATGEAWAKRRLQAGSQFTPVAYPGTEESFEALLRGEVDAVLNDHLNSEFLLAHDYAGRLVVARRFGSPLLLTRDELAFPFRPGLEAVRDTFDATLQELERGGTLDRLRWQWLPPHAETDWGEVFAWVAAVALALAAAGALLMAAHRRRTRRQALTESERHYRQLVEQAPVGFLMVRDRVVAFASPLALELLHAPSGQGVLGRPPEELVSLSDREALLAFRRASEAGDSAVHAFDLSVLRPDGSTFPAHLTVRRADLEGGPVSLILFEDRSALRQTEARLEDSERARARFLKNLPGMAYHRRNDRDWTLLAVSDGALDLTGYWPDELISPQGPRYAQVLHPDDRQRVSDEVVEALASGALFQLRYRITTASGQVKWVSEQGWAVPGSGTPPAELEGFIVDETDQAKIRQELARREAEYRRIFEDSTEGIYVSTAEGRPVLANPALVRMLGYETEQELNRRDIAREGYVDPADRERFAALMERDGRVTGFESRWYRKDRSVIVTLVNSRAVRGPDGRVALYEGMVRDVTEERKTQAALAESEARYRSLFESSYDAIFLADAGTGRLLDANRRAQELVGRSLEEIRSMHQMELHPEEERERYRAIFEAHASAGAGGLTADLLVVHRDGRRIPVDIAGSTFSLAGRRVQVGIFRDTTTHKASEEALRESEGRLRRILEQAPIAMAIVGLDGTIEYINRKAVETFGYTHEEIPTMDRWWVQAYPDPAYREEVVGSWMGRVEAALAERREIEGREYRVVCRDGSTKTAFIFGVPVADKIFVLFQDVTVQRGSEEALRRSEAQYRLTIDGLTDGVHLVGRDLRILLFNGTLQRWVEELDLPGDIAGKTVFEVFPFLPDQVRKEYERVFDTGEPLVTEDRSVIGAVTMYTETRKIPVVEEGRVARVLTVIRDVTARYEAERALRESEERFRVVIEQTGHLVYDLDVVTSHITWSGAIETVTGWSPEEFDCDLPGWEALIHPEDRTHALELLGEAMASQEPYRVEYRFRRKDGTYFWVEDHGVFLSGPDGKAARMLGTMADVTARREALDALRRSEQDYRGLFENAHEAILLFEPETEAILDANPNACALYGFSREELLSMSLVRLSKDAARGKTRIRETLEQKRLQGMETVHFRRDGSEILLEVNATAVEFGGRKAILSMNRDVTERRRAEEEILKSRARLQLLLDRSPLACVVWDPSFRATLWNPSAQRLFGYSAAEALGRHPYEIIVPPEARDHVDAIWERLLQGDETAHSENENLRSDGSRLFCEWFNTPLKEAGGKVVGVLSMAQDVTERRRAERQILDRNRQLSALLSASEAMTGFLDPAGSARALCQAALEAFDLRMAWIGLIVPESTEVQVLASAGHDEGYTEQLRVRWDESPRAQGPTGVCIKTRRPVIGHPDQTGFAPWRQAAEARGYRATCSLPLVHEDAVRGALTLYSADPDAFAPEMLEVLQIFARQATMLLVNAALYQEARRTVEALLSAAHPDGEPPR